MTWKVFIGYSSEDNDKAQYIFDCLGRIVQIQPYKAEIYLQFGEDFKKKIQNELDTSQFMIVLLTNNGIRSQWVNQEIGYAYALKKRPRLLPALRNLPHIIPVSESQAELKGLITKDTIDILFLDKYVSFEVVIANIISTIRCYIPRGLEKGVLKTLVACSNCLDEEGFPFEYECLIPSQATICKIIESEPQPLLAYSCPRCHTKNAIDARTFSLIQLSGKSL